MTAVHQLESTLRSLKLSGMLDTLKARLLQARAGEIGHQELLQVLCEDELNRRAATAVTRRVRAARFEEQASLEDFDFTVSAKLPVHAIRDLATLRFLERAESVVLHGPVGIGKSHVAQALGNLACRRNLSVTFLKASRALAHLAGGHADRTWTARLRKLANVDLLILDDFGVRMFTDAQADDLYELITERTGRSTIYTANRAPADWYPLFPNPVVAESLLDRLVNNSHVLLMDGPSYRPRKRPTRVSPDTKEVKPDYPATTDPVGNCVTPALGNSMTFHRLVQGRPYSRFVRRRAQPRGGYGQRRRLSC